MKVGQTVKLTKPPTKEIPVPVVKKGKINDLFIFDNLGRKAVTSASAGEVVCFGGMENVEIGDTLLSGTDVCKDPLPPIFVESPTVKMTFGVNKSPLGGKEGKFLTSRMIRDRLMKELDKNVSLKVEEGASSDIYEVSGRGQLHLTVLIEEMRREGFEMEIGPPKVIMRMNEETGKREEPWEKLEIRVPDEYLGKIVDLLNSRKGEMLEMGKEEEMSSLVFLIPTRGMLGLRSAAMTSSRGTALIDSVFHSYRPEVKGMIGAPGDNGSLLAHSSGSANSNGIAGAQDRGKMFIAPGDEVYKGMIVGVHQRPGDLEINVCKMKQLTNMRASGKDNWVGIVTPLELTLDGGVEYISEDEVLEVTPTKIRMAKNPNFVKQGRPSRIK